MMIASRDKIQGTFVLAEKYFDIEICEAAWRLGFDKLRSRSLMRREQLFPSCLLKFFHVSFQLALQEER